MWVRLDQGAAAQYQRSFVGCEPAPPALVRGLLFLETTPVAEHIWAVTSLDQLSFTTQPYGEPAARSAWVSVNSLRGEVTVFSAHGRDLGLDVCLPEALPETLLRVILNRLLPPKFLGIGEWSKTR